MYSSISKNFIFSIRSLYLVVVLSFLFINTGRTQIILDSYSNNFNSPSDDFEGNGFSIITPEDFSNPAIHTVHPYPHSPVTTRDTVLYYSLKHSIRVNASNPVIIFDEVLLSGDIVRVQAFSVKSNTWITLASYTSSDFSPWVLRLNSLLSGWDSKATGTSSLYRQREVNLLTNPAIKPGDEIKIRFCLFSNWIGNAWGWSIDNLKIQPDVVPPSIKHYHFDYAPVSVKQIPIYAEVQDGFSNVNNTFVEYKVGNSIWFSKKLLFGGYYFNTIDLYSFNIKPNDTVFYKLKSTDMAGNTSVIPNDIKYWTIIMKDFEDPVTTYFNDFELTNRDFIGNYFNVGPLPDYPGKLVQTVHPYPNGFGPNDLSYSLFAYTLMKPVIIASENPIFSFDEAILTEWNAQDDFVGVEGSRDFGNEWVPIDYYYNSRLTQLWMEYSDAGFSPPAKIFRQRKIDLLEVFNPGDTVIFRFAFYANGDSQRWGWAFDNVSIQSKITSTKEYGLNPITIYPNPAKEFIRIRLESGVSQGTGMFINSSGQIIEKFTMDSGIEKEISISGWSEGIYYFRYNSDGISYSRKFLKIDSN